MRIKTFERPTMAEVMEAVKAEMGYHAVILDVKESKKGIFSPLARPMATVVAATDFTPADEIALLEKERISKRSAAPPSLSTPHENQQGLKEIAQKESLLHLSRAMSQRLRPPVGVPTSVGVADTAKTMQKPPLSLPIAPPLAKTTVPMPSADGNGSGERGGGTGRLLPLHKTCGFVARCGQTASCLPVQVLMPAAEGKGGSVEVLNRPIGGRGLLKLLYNRVLDAGLDKETASHLFGLVVKKMAGDHFTEGMVTDYLRNVIREWVMRFAPPAPIGGPEKIIALVGPTGVGKTTTLIKIATRLYQAKKKVTLATMDTYRVGAVEQLRTYAQILGAPIRVISSAEALKHLWMSRQAGEYLLMDTAGRSPFHDRKLQTLTVLTEVPVEVHLALAAGTRETDLHETLSSFSKVIPIDRLLFTKLDETRRLGSLFSVIRKGGKGGITPSYLTTGQRVPEDIEEATPDRIAEAAVPLLG